MSFLQWCRTSDRWRIHAWASDPACRLPTGTDESPAAYADTFTAAGYGAYLHRLADDSAWGEYVRAGRDAS